MLIKSMILFFNKFTFFSNLGNVNNSIMELTEIKMRLYGATIENDIHSTSITHYIANRKNLSRLRTLLHKAGKKIVVDVEFITKCIECKQIVDTKPYEL